MIKFWDSVHKGNYKKYQLYNLIYKLKYSEDGYTAYDLAEELGVHPKTAARHLRELWSLDLVHISGWDREHHMPIPVLSWGEGKDKPSPKPLTNKEKAKRYRQKVKETKEIDCVR